MRLAQRKPAIFTAEQYLEFERKSEVRHELINGEIYEMAGAVKRHNLISTNIIRLLANQLLERDCNVYGSDMRVKITAAGNYTYPDIVAVCGEEIYEDATEDTLVNPMLFLSRRY